MLVCLFSLFIYRCTHWKKTNGKQSLYMAVGAIEWNGIQVFSTFLVLQTPQRKGILCFTSVKTVLKKNKFLFDFQRHRAKSFFTHHLVKENYVQAVHKQESTEKTWLCLRPSSFSCFLLAQDISNSILHIIPLECPADLKFSLQNVF